MSCGAISERMVGAAVGGRGFSPVGVRRERAPIPGAKLLQKIHRLGGERRSLALEPAIAHLEEILGKIRNILAAVAQRRKGYGDYVDPIEKIGAEAAGFDFAPERAAGGADDARVHAYFFVAAYSA